MLNILKHTARVLGQKLIALADTAPAAAAQPAVPTMSTGRIFVKSSVIKSMAFTPTTQGRGLLLIEYVKGDIYQYDDVERADYEALRDADSKGTHLNCVFKPQYKGRQID